MPVQRVPVDEIEKAVATIERTARIVAVLHSGPGCVLVFTEPRGKGVKETRG